MHNAAKVNIFLFIAEYITIKLIHHIHIIIIMDRNQLGSKGIQSMQITSKNINTFYKLQKDIVFVTLIFKVWP